jgi:PAS domain S-box-containing protein
VRQLELLHPWLSQTGQPQTTTLAERLDALSVAKAQRAISGEIQPDKLAQTLLRIVMESAGAQIGYLSVEGASQLRAEMRPNDSKIGHIVFDVSPQAANIPEAIINYVRRSRKTVPLDDAPTKTGEFSADDYLRHEKPKSALCMAIQRQDKLLGVLYLENNLVSGAFTPERRTILEVLAAQAAISLETAGVYEKLQESEERLRSVLNASDIVAWEANPEKGKLYEAGPVGKLFGRSKGFSHTQVDDFANSIHPDDRDRVMDSIDRSLHGEGGYNVEFRVPMADGCVRWITANGSLQTYTEGKPGRLLGIARDITNQKLAEDELRAHRDHLEELVKQRAAELTIARDVAEEARRLAEAANKAKSIFLANISHELRTPLNAILGYSQLMQRDTSLLPEQRGYLNTINRSGEHLLALINDVLEISKIEAGQITLDVGAFDLWALLGDMEEMFKVRTNSKGLHLDFTGINEVPRYSETDENKLRQILINVLGNAVKFTQHGSVTLRVSTKCMDHGAECKDTRDSGAQRLCFEVEDTGVGIAEQELYKVFAAFGQTESGRISRTGTGLGMAITQSYVHLMGGDISVVSTPGKGSTFRLEISVNEVSQADSKERTMVQRRVIGLEPDQDIPRILVAEDVDESRAMLGKLLRIVGFHVREALNGKQAIEIFQHWQPDFIWMDIRMPEMDGLEATRHIKQTDAGKSTVIAALTAHALEEERKQILAAGCDDVVRKPLREQDIFDVMEKHLGLRYMYEDAKDEREAVKPKEEIGSDQLADLPADLLSQLYQAALELNEQQSLALIEKIKPIDADIARKLEVLVRNFAYDSLQYLVKRNQQSSPGDTHE